MRVNRIRLVLTSIIVLGLLTIYLISQGARELLAQTGAKPVAEKTAKAAVAKPAERDGRATDQAAIRKTMQSFTEAFQKSDAPAAAAFMTEGAELISAEGAVIRGRQAIQQAYADHFAANARPKISLEVASLEFPSRDTAVEEGQMTISTSGAKGVDATTNHYHILYVREDGKWYLAGVRESAADESPLEELEWLIGTWAVKAKDSEAHTSYEWFGNKAFIRAQFSIREKETTVTGMQIIGLDPVTNALRTWTFEADGGVGEGICMRDGNKWIFETSTALTDRRVMSASNTWQPIDLTIDGEKIANLPPVKVVRVESRK
jgi:uncharacterized protein (TIGR02246 family)